MSETATEVMPALYCRWQMYACLDFAKGGGRIVKRDEELRATKTIDTPQNKRGVWGKPIVTYTLDGDDANEYGDVPTFKQAVYADPERVAVLRQREESAKVAP